MYHPGQASGSAVAPRGMGSAPEPRVTLFLLLTLFTAQPHTGDRTHAHGHSAMPCGNPLGFQVLLDKLGFSPGEIDGTVGPNLRRAITAFQASAGMESSGTPDCATWDALTRGNSPETLIEYEITEADVQGPYLDGPLPGELATQAKLPSLSYASVAEALAERFHTSPRLLARLNTGKPFEAGTILRLPAVTPFDPSRKATPDATASDVTIEVSRSGSTLRAVRADGSQSHGCVRLTTWDAARLASLVKPGTRVVLTE